MGEPSASRPPSSSSAAMCCLIGGGDAVLRQQFADGAALALRRGAVVAPDVEDQRVVAIAEPVDLVDDPADLNIHVLGEARRHFHQAALEGLLVLGDAVPGRHRLVPRGELGVGGDPAFLLGALEDALAIGVPAVVELALILVGPLLHDVVRAVDRAARPVHEERLVRLEGLVLVQPADRVVRQVFAEVVALLRAFSAAGRGRVAHQVRLVLRGLAGQEAVEIFEAEAGRPVLERAGRRSSPRRACCATCPRRPWRSRSPSAPRRPARCSWECGRNSHPSHWPAPRSARCRPGDDCGRSAGTPGWASTSPWCGTGCRRSLP